ncbi:integral membrane protein, TerC family [Leptospira fainei serovar Hurstbridge str. BUT 6]|uniref:Integral membrane protein, TerC family n=1 Tax=Leptospira fainei serovar Hurstbridge str. BUT 6 TaxID=1193011 RepID=S3UQ89_9LEPT|nr:TerC family protein [Leptospira fainei]EPG72571.1 integral membrane protein, TerC family [Leptospira fainei serovar Hurstbridge str. BUT 6]
MLSFSQKDSTLFLIFTVGVGFLIYLDLFVLNKKARKLSLRESGYWTLFWVSLALGFASIIYIFHEDPTQPTIAKEKTLEFLAGYLLEYSLSVDNLFVFIMIFAKFRIQSHHQPMILKWGILGALIFRALMIFSGAELVSRFEWILYLFGILLLYSAWKMYFHTEEEDFDPEEMKLLKYAKKILPMTSTFHPEKLMVSEQGKRVFTSTFLILLVVEFSDILFAVDSIPAIFSITQDSFIIYTSNVFAILGLRSLFFLLGGVMELFVHLKKGVSLLLAFVGIKLLLPAISKPILGEEIHVSIEISLFIIIGTLTLSVLASLPHYLSTKKEPDSDF